MSLRESFLNEVAREPLQPAPDRSPPLEALTKVVDQIWEMPGRARLPRCTRSERQDLATRVFPEQPSLTSATATFLDALEKSGYPRRPPVQAAELKELQGKERHVQRIVAGAGRLLQAATDGALVQNGLLARLNGRVLRSVRTLMGQGGEVEREILRSRWDAVFLLLDRRRAAAEAGRRQLEKREAELLAQAEATEQSGAVDEALSRLRALLGRAEGGRP